MDYLILFGVAAGLIGFGYYLSQCCGWPCDVSELDDCVELSDSIYWKIIPIYKEVDGVKLIEFQWGYTAGLSDEDLKNYADDAPSGYEKVTTTLDLAVTLRDELNKIIEQHMV